MSVSGELLCSFELLKPLDSTALKNHIKKGRNKRNSMLNSPVSQLVPCASCLVPSDRHCAVQRCRDSHCLCASAVSGANKYCTYSLQHHLPKVTKIAAGLLRVVIVTGAPAVAD